jgi:hypothetical protein
MTPTTQTPSWQGKGLHKNIYFQRWNMTPPMAEKVHFLMLRYDPTSCPRKDCTQMLDVYVNSFFNFEIWLRYLSKKRIAQKISDVVVKLGCLYRKHGVFLPIFRIPFTHLNYFFMSLIKFCIF